MTEEYLARKLSGRCTYPGCAAMASDTCLLCDAHKEEANKRTKRVRSDWKGKKRCTRCGGRRSPRSRWGCVTCLIKVGRAKQVAKTKHKTKTERLRANTAVDAEGRVRYHGKAKRGAPSKATNNADAVADMRKALQRGEEALALVESDEVKALPRIQREEVKLAALAPFDLLRRTARELLEANRYPLGDEKPDDDE